MYLIYLFLYLSHVISYSLRVLVTSIRKEQTHKHYCYNNYIHHFGYLLFHYYYTIKLIYIQINKRKMVSILTDGHHQNENYYSDFTNIFILTQREYLCKVCSPHILIIKRVKSRLLCVSQTNFCLNPL